jgi:hypothetical protein
MEVLQTSALTTWPRRQESATNAPSEVRQALGQMSGAVGELCVCVEEKANWVACLAISRPRLMTALRQLSRSGRKARSIFCFEGCSV